jgi:mRNA-degrading endonuclease RelE of RelBE toxin-antitoxin system
MSFRAIFSPKSCKAIKSFDPELKERIKKGIQEISNNPWEKGTIKVKGYGDVRRKRVGDYRIIYCIDPQRKEILIAFVARRNEETYKL